MEYATKGPELQLLLQLPVAVAYDIVVVVAAAASVTAADEDVVD